MAIKPSKPGAGFAWRFHYGLRTLKRAYETSRTTADKEKAGIEEKAARFQKKVDAGKASWVQYSEDGYPEFDYGEHLGELIDDEETALALIRAAFVIAIHHYIKHQIGERLSNKYYEQEKAFAWLKGYGWKPLETELNELRLTANCAKHSGSNAGKQLYALRPDMFDSSKIKMGFDPAHDSLALNDAHVEAFFEAVKQSIPNNLGIAL